VPAAHRHLEALAVRSRWSALFSDEERTVLHRALDLASCAMAEMRRLPPTFVHGGFHIRNLGFDRGRGDCAQDTLVMIDWAHAGIAPLGCDVATLVSLYSVMGGASVVRHGLEQACVLAYCEEIAHIVRQSRQTGLEPSHVVASVGRAGDLWHLTWGLHLRLGPGLDWLLRRPDQDADDAQHAAADIREGSLRALSALTRL
jgi:aminoglycoside phosphotransferase (APT) family kinase protein